MPVLHIYAHFFTSADLSFIVTAPVNYRARDYSQRQIHASAFTVQSFLPVTHIYTPGPRVSSVSESSTHFLRQECDCLRASSVLIPLIWDQRCVQTFRHAQLVSRWGTNPLEFIWTPFGRAPAGVLLVRFSGPHCWERRGCKICSHCDKAVIRQLLHTVLTVEPEYSQSHKFLSVTAAVNMVAFFSS